MLKGQTFRPEPSLAWLICRILAVAGRTQSANWVDPYLGLCIFKACPVKAFVSALTCLIPLGVAVGCLMRLTRAGETGPDTSQISPLHRKASSLSCQNSFCRGRRTILM